MFCPFLPSIQQFMLNAIWKTNNIMLSMQLQARKKNHFRFFSEMIKFRLKHTTLRHENFLNKVIPF